MAMLITILIAAIGIFIVVRNMEGFRDVFLRRDRVFIEASDVIECHVCGQKMKRQQREQQCANCHNWL
ncbi:hypothetical protein H0266_04710 [Halobacillus locisalis]|uniref:Uncharacterized protein n=1 Tax=Halobacillus locisalis TaxID=220753 RepID=A0A838CQG4_9BACI|nr:hypothetical protein [Halobacillus locisalis]MBA2174201.1 hypothetical protein [Halobacillus locisalis]